MKHTYRRINRETFRICIQLPTPYPKEPYKVWRIRSQSGVHSFQLEGLILDCPKIRRRVVVANALPDEVVMITYVSNNGITPLNRAYYISKSLIPVPIDNLEPFGINQTIANGPIMDYNGKNFLHYRETELREFFRGTHPEWLQMYVESTLRLWRRESPDLFVRIAPMIWLVQKPWLFAMHDPKRALSEYPHLLNRDLRQYCIRRMVTPVSRDLAQLIPSNLKPVCRFDNSAFLLAHHVNELTDSQLRNCARTSPSKALQIVPGIVDPRHRAIVLSCTYPPAWYERSMMRNLDYRDEVLDSISDYYDEWIISHPNGLSEVFKFIAKRLIMPSTAQELVHMLSGLKPEVRQKLAAIIAELV